MSAQERDEQSLALRVYGCSDLFRYLIDSHGRLRPADEIYKRFGPSGAFFDEKIYSLCEGALQGVWGQPEKAAFVCTPPFCHVFSTPSITTVSFSQEYSL